MAKSHTNRHNCLQLPWQWVTLHGTALLLIARYHFAFASWDFCYITFMFNSNANESITTVHELFIVAPLNPTCCTNVTYVESSSSSAAQSSTRHQLRARNSKLT